MRIEATDEDKGWAFEWLRQQALSNQNPRAFYAAILLQDIADLKGQRPEAGAMDDGDRIAFLQSNPRLIAFAEGYHGGVGVWTYRDRHLVTHEAASLRDAIDSAKRTNGPSVP
jgi:hypothetical protein